MTSTPVNVKDNTTPLKPANGQFKVSKFGRQRYWGSQNKEPRVQFSKTDYVPYSINDVKKSIRYFGSTCGYYHYANALTNYLNHLQQYKKGHLQRPPKYPDLCEFQPDPPKKYKRPAMYQGINSVASARTWPHSKTTVVPSEREVVKPVEKEVTLLHEVPEEIITLIK
jgi:hypothetical protein